MIYRVAITGGIGSGKSSAATIFVELGVTLIDTDAVAHQLTAPDGAAIPEIRAAFGDAAIQPSGAMDRAHMRKLVFQNAEARGRLEGILHPLIRRTVEAQVQQVTGPYALIAVPLLFETNSYVDAVQRVVVVDCSEEQQVSRTMARSGLSEQEVRRIMATQVSRAERLSRADDVLDNSGGPSELRDQVTRLHADYVARARQWAAPREPDKRRKQ